MSEVVRGREGRSVSAFNRLSLRSYLLYTLVFVGLACYEMSRPQGINADRLIQLGIGLLLTLGITARTLSDVYAAGQVEGKAVPGTPHGTPKPERDGGSAEQAAPADRPRQ